jgi:hypothetical protein
MKTITSMPSFNAESTLNDAKVSYRYASHAVVQGGIVQPTRYPNDATSRSYGSAAQSAVEDKTVRPASVNGGLLCLKFKFKCFGPDNCGWQTSIGHVNPVTGRCE